MIDTSAPSPLEVQRILGHLNAERPTYPTFLVGGRAHGREWDGEKGPEVCVPIAQMPLRYELAPGLSVECRVDVERYRLTYACISGVQAKWLYYRHESLSEYHAVVMLWALLWEAAIKRARAGGWQESKKCPCCKGSGMDPRQ